MRRTLQSVLSRCHAGHVSISGPRASSRHGVCERAEAARRRSALACLATSPLKPLRAARANPDAGTGGTSVVSTNTTTWTTGKTSTETYTVKTFSGKKDKCPAQGAILSTLEIKEKGKVTGGTANLVGTKLKATVCLYSNDTVTQFPGTTLSF